ncbi:hypothetical protein JXA63_03390 [Candidatus Woesebacteria bacterium]|nr:hypothetical protein [Candidatus Woesebacteria bacterium]
MWMCARCGRIFKKKGQPHSCKKVTLEKHFKKKEEARRLFDHLLDQIDKKVGKVKIITIPCCIHLYGNYDFLAALPKKDRLEIRFALDREIKSSRLKTSVPMSKKVFKNCFDIKSKEEIDKELLEWIEDSYHLKD